MLNKIKKIFKKEKSETKSVKKKPLFDLGNDLDSGVGIRIKKRSYK
jgi:hypothetical protein